MCKISLFRRGSVFFRFIAVVVICAIAGLLFLNRTSLDNVYDLPVPGRLVSLSGKFDPAVLKGIKFYRDDPMRLGFIVDPGDEKNVSTEDVTRFIKYFLAGTTLPENELWVNLSPYDKDRVATEKLAATDLGKDMLCQDYILKQLSSSLTHPDTPTGRAYWGMENRELEIENGSTQISNIESLISTERAVLSKIWIKPDQSVIYENGDIVYITEATLKADAGADGSDSGTYEQNGRNIVSPLQTLLPVVTREINQGRNFATLRQFYHSLILAFWFKEKFKDTLYMHYINQGKIKGIDLTDKGAKDRIYDLYVKSFKKGAYDVVRDVSVSFASNETDTSRTNGIGKRRFFSGGLDMVPDIQRAASAPLARHEVLLFDARGEKLVSSAVVTADNTENADRAQYSNMNRSAGKKYSNAGIRKVGPVIVMLSAVALLLFLAVEEAFDNRNDTGADAGEDDAGPVYDRKHNKSAVRGFFRRKLSGFAADDNDAFDAGTEEDAGDLDAGSYDAGEDDAGDIVLNPPPLFLEEVFDRYMAIADNPGTDVYRDNMWSMALKKLAAGDILSIHPDLRLELIKELLNGTDNRQYYTSFLRSDVLVALGSMDRTGMPQEDQDELYDIMSSRITSDCRGTLLDDIEKMTALSEDEKTVLTGLVYDNMGSDFFYNMDTVKKHLSEEEFGDYLSDLVFKKPADALNFAGNYMQDLKPWEMKRVKQIIRRAYRNGTLAEEYSKEYGEEFEHFMNASYDKWINGIEPEDSSSSVSELKPASAASSVNGDLGGVDMTRDEFNLKTAGRSVGISSAVTGPDDYNGLVFSIISKEKLSSQKLNQFFIKE